MEEEQEADYDGALQTGARCPGKGKREECQGLEVLDASCRRESSLKEGRGELPWPSGANSILE